MAKRHYLRVSVNGHDVLLIVGFRPKCPFVQTGLWARPLTVTELPADLGSLSTNILFMAWLIPRAASYQVERLWPEGRAREYATVRALLPVVEEDLLRVALHTARSKFAAQSSSCNRPNYGIMEETQWRLTVEVLFDCPIPDPSQGLPREACSVYAKETLDRSGGDWKRSGISASAVLCGLR